MVQIVSVSQWPSPSMMPMCPQQVRAANHFLSLFHGTDWKNVVIDEVMHYLENQSDITGNCSNPYLLPLVLKDRFLLTEKGLMLFPPGYKEKNHQLYVIIPWEKLQPYLRSDIAAKLK